MAPLNSSRSSNPSDDSLASLDSSAAMISPETLAAPHKSPHRFTVSPVSPESEPLLRSDSQLSNLSVSPASTFLKVPGPRNTEEDEGFLEGLRRVRHASNRSDATADTFLEDEELGDIPLTPLEGAATDDLVVVSETGNMGQGCYENPALLPSPCIITPEPTALQPDVIYTRAPPVIITSHPSDASLPHPPTDSLQASHWDVRNPTVQFYVGSCLSVASATSHVSFFNTLYAHGYTPICRICHQPASDKRPLYTPCLCTGSLRFVHHSCLMRWLDTRTKQLGHNPKCELCAYQFRAQKRWRSRKNIRWPSIPMRDKILHCIFFLALILMGISLGIIGTLFKRDLPAGVGEEKKDKSGMSPTETVTLACGIVFFVAFFAATLAQIKASWNLWRMVRIFWDNNYVLQLENDLEANQKDANNTGISR